MAYTPFTPIAIGSLAWGTPLNTAIQNLDRAQTTNAQDHDLLYWQFDPGTNMVGSTITSGTVSMSKLWFRQSVTITNVALSITTVGAALVAGQNFAGLYDSLGTLLSSTADQTANWGTIGFKEMALTAPQAVAAGYYYVAVVSNAGTTPAFARGSALTASIANAKLTATNGRFTTGPAGQTTLPASITMAARTLTGNALWVAVS